MTKDPLKTAKSAGVATVTINHRPANLVDGPFIMGLAIMLDQLGPEFYSGAVLCRRLPGLFPDARRRQAIMAMKAGVHGPVTAPNFAAAVFERLRQSLVSIA
jgi:hypothetical protein